jgi:hypothetical protein
MLSGKRCYAIDDDERRCAFRIRNFESLQITTTKEKNSTLPNIEPENVTLFIKTLKVES